MLIAQFRFVEMVRRPCNTIISIHQIVAEVKMVEGIGLYEQERVLVLLSDTPGKHGVAEFCVESGLNSLVASLAGIDSSERKPLAIGQLEQLVPDPGMIDGYSPGEWA